MSNTKEILYALQTSRGIITFSDPSELQPWLDKGLNRFDLLGPPKLEEIEVIHPGPLVSPVVYVGVDWETQEIKFFEDEGECASWTEESNERESDTHTVGIY
jgi:hypothetical protein